MFYPKPEPVPKKRPESLPAGVRSRVLYRDHMCFAFRMDAEHVCADTFGEVHSPYDLNKLTCEHVKPELKFGQRPPHREEYLVALCASLNGGSMRVATKELREQMRGYLAKRYPDVWRSDPP